MYVSFIGFGWMELMFLGVPVIAGVIVAVVMLVQKSNN